MAVVIDASVAFGWIVRSQATALTAAALSKVAHEFGCVPAYFGLEVARALRAHERRKLIPADVIDIGLAQLKALPLRQDKSGLLDRMPEIIALARRHSIRVADAAYLELALRTTLPLATRDEPLARAAIAAGVRLFKS